MTILEHQSKMKGILKTKGIDKINTIGSKWEGNLKNLAYLDKEIHDVIVKRKKAQVCIQSLSVLWFLFAF
jgi:hypothetical protein